MSIIYQKYYLDPSVLLKYKCIILKSLLLGHKKHDKEDDDEEEDDDDDEKHHSNKKGIFLNYLLLKIPLIILFLELKPSKITN